MPRYKDGIPRYCKHRASGQAVCTLGGHDHYLGRHGTKASLVAYDRLIAEWLAGGRSARAVNPSAGVSVVEIIADYLRFAGRRYVKNGEPSTEFGLIRSAMRPLKYLYGATPATEFGPLALKAVRQKFVEAGNSRGTVNKNVARVCRMFRWAAVEELIPAAIPQALSMVPGLRAGQTEAREPAPIQSVEDATVVATLAQSNRQADD